MLQHLKMDPSERAVCDDLSRLKAEEQHAYYLETCEDLGLDPATFPLRRIVVDGRLALAVETCIGAVCEKALHQCLIGDRTSFLS
jgi:hypothetical protein